VIDHVSFTAQGDQSCVIKITVTPSPRGVDSSIFNFLLAATINIRAVPTAVTNETTQIPIPLNARVTLDYGGCSGVTATISGHRDSLD
jgi:hypothetical protein